MGSCNFCGQDVTSGNNGLQLLFSKKSRGSRELDTEKEFGIALVCVRVSGFYQGFCAEIKGTHYSGQKTRESQDLALMPPSWEHYKVSNEAPLLAKGKIVVEQGWTC